MKTPSDPRHKRRREIVKLLFAQSFHPQKSRSTIVNEIIGSLDKIDPVIGKLAPEFPVVKINRVDLAILRLAVFELLERRSEPPKVIVDEAVELAKEYGGESSPAFINGALGKLLKNTYGDSKI